MNDTTKPLADIIAEARNKYTVHDCNECDYRKSCDLRFDCDECKANRKSISLAFGIEDDYFTKLLDRIEAAAKYADAMCRKNEEAAFKRGQSATGSAAAMREALEDSNGLLREIRGEWRDAAEAQIEDNNAALAAPARNCDRLQTGDRLTDAVSALNAYANEEEHEPVRRWNESDWRRFLDWFFAPAKQEGGAK